MTMDDAWDVSPSWQELKERLDSIAPCFFHDTDHEVCISHSGQVPCMTKTEADWLNALRAEAKGGDS